MLTDFFMFSLSLSFNFYIMLRSKDWKLSRAVTDVFTEMVMDSPHENKPIT